MLTREEEEEDRRVVTALRRVGVRIDGIYDLVNRPKTPDAALPVLVMHLGETEQPRIKEGIVRALSVREARGLAGPALIREFRKLPFEPPRADAAQALKWAIANALSVTATDDLFEDIADLALDRRHGRARNPLAEALSIIDHPRVDGVLLRLLDDDQVFGHAIVALGRRRTHAAAERIEPFLSHREAWIRTAARKALRRIDTAKEPR
jgi:HEAT repeat protein